MRMDSFEVHKNIFSSIILYFLFLCVPDDSNLATDTTDTT